MDYLTNKRPKATSPPQELEVGVHRAPYLLVYIYLNTKIHFEVFSKF